MNLKGFSKLTQNITSWEAPNCFQSQK